MVQDWRGAAAEPGLACMHHGDEDLQPVRCKVERDGQQWPGSICSSRSHPATPAPPFCRPPRVGHLGANDEEPARRSSRSKCRRAEAGGPEFWPARDGHLPSRWPARRQGDGCASRVRLEHRTREHGLTTLLKGQRVAPFRSRASVDTALRALPTARLAALGRQHRTHSTRPAHESLPLTSSSGWATQIAM